MLQEQLSQQLKNLVTLREILEEEKRCLTEKDFSSFNDTLFNKQKSLQTIATLDKQLSTAKNLELINQSDELTELKNTLSMHLQDSQSMNTVNGKLVELSMKSNKHLMQLMTQATGKNSVTYDQKGLLQGGQLLGKNIQA
jgi:flagella synthesis protein FlgN